MAPSAETRALVEELRSDRAGPARRRARRAAAGGARAREHAPLVGRREPLAALRAAWRRASAGAAGVVMLCGEAGSGKTRLLIELAGEARTRGATVLAGRCFEDGVVAFAPFTEALRRQSRRPAALPEWVVDRARPPPARARAGGRGAGGRADDARHRLFEAVAAAIGRRRAGGRRCCSSSRTCTGRTRATIQMLAHVIRHGRRGRRCWSPGRSARRGARRSRRWTPCSASCERDRPPRASVVLGGLSAGEVGELAAAWLGASRRRRACAAVIHRRTGGNPLFVEELAAPSGRIASRRPAEELVAAAGDRGARRR